MDKITKLGIAISAGLFAIGIVHEAYATPFQRDAVCTNWTCQNPAIGEGIDFYSGYDTSTPPNVVDCDLGGSTVVVRICRTSSGSQCTLVTGINNKQLCPGMSVPPNPNDPRVPCNVNWTKCQ